MSNAIYATPLTTIDGKSTTLGAYANEVLLVVNVASQCGLTKQYQGLESLYQTWHAQGFEVLGFPCNEFGAQEPGSEEEIQAFCTTQFGVSFPMFSKIEVNGDGRHPLYKALIAAKPQAIKPEGSEFYQRLASKGREPLRPENILWNFEKFLVGRNGQVLARFAPDMTPEDPILVAAIGQAVAK
ncbi:glutathione peroxidase [Rahnella sp. SAP-1]|jgi:glutathione peroxidase|uniref:Thioredoxin/glutathione peroxidase BtuE n=1 Tax=Rouxiella aceris TaxID=2703884 RepID=A0A848MP42_9GAMM|nr:glutathione peroxidase [Rouxiella aceris]NMP28839.1 glutathione peroxidase [Rouxiella aceris]